MKIRWPFIIVLQFMLCSFVAPKEFIVIGKFKNPSCEGKRVYLKVSNKKSRHGDIFLGSVIVSKGHFILKGRISNISPIRFIASNAQTESFPFVLNKNNIHILFDSNHRVKLKGTRKHDAYLIYMTQTESNSGILWNKPDTVIPLKNNQDKKQLYPVIISLCVAVLLIMILLALKIIVKQRRKKEGISGNENQRNMTDSLVALGAEEIAKEKEDKINREKRYQKQKENALKSKRAFNTTTEDIKVEKKRIEQEDIETSKNNSLRDIEEKKDVKYPPSKRKINIPYIDSDEAQIKIIKSIPEQESSTPKRIGYLPNTKFKQTEPYAYAVVKMPQINSLIKFPRKGRSDKKGYKEDDFLLQLNTYFKSTFSIFNDRHVPTGSGKPYEPDFVLSSEKDNKNIFINIEIDEPYDGWMRTPTHCIGDNDLRDDFFTKRGWIVIRFAEIQIHLEPKKCCALIAKVIQSIDPLFYSDLLEESIPSHVMQWDNLQAKKWASEKYREGYLKIQSFGKRPNVVTEYDITESENDRAVEREIPKQKITIEADKGYLATENKIDRDNRIMFDSVEHRYYIDGNPDTISVTQLIDKFFPEFDAEYWAPIKAAQRGITTKEMLKEWEDKRLDSANKGTILHEAIENFYNKRNYNESTTEFQQFLSFNNYYQSIKPFRSEWRIFDEDLLVAGTIDMVFIKEDGSLFMFDWKRSEKVVTKDGIIKNDKFKFAFGGLSHLGDNSYIKYCLQQNIYRAILEKRYNQKISSMNLLVMHETFNSYHIVKIPPMDKEVNYIFSSWYLTK